MALIIGTGGNDTLTGTFDDDDIEGRGGNDIIRGGAGKDILLGEGGDDLLYGEAGDDILEGGTGDDLVDGGDGFDIASWILAGSGVTVDLAITGPQNTGQGMDTLVGIEGLAGSDYNDTLYAGHFSSFLSGGLGADSLYGRGGHDELNGGDGDDLLDGGDGNDLLIGGLGNDILRGGKGFDTAYFFGGPAVTIDLRLSAAQNTGQGMDTLIDIEDVVGTAYADVIHGNNESNVLNGGQGSDKLYGYGGDDVLMVSGVGLETYVLDGGDGYDTVRTDSSLSTIGSTLVSIEYILAAGTVSLDAASFNTLGVQRITAYSISIYQGGVVNLSGIYSGRSVDLYNGGGVNLAGSEAFHQIRAQSGPRGVTAIGGDNGNWIDGAEGDDVLTGGAYYDQILGGAGNDTIYGLGGEDTLAGGFGDDIIYGGDGKDSLSGGGGHDILYGGAGDDSIYVTLGNDVAYGEEGNDFFTVDLWGGTNLTVFGGAGDDSVLVRFGEGGVTLGTARLDGGDGDDIITFYNYGTTTQDISGFDLSGFERVGGDHLTMSVAQLRTIKLELSGSLTLKDTGYIDLRGSTGLPRTINLSAASELDMTGAAAFPATSIIPGIPLPPGTVGTRTVNGSAGDDIIRGGLGNDQLIGGAGNDALYGQEGDDTFVGGAGDDRMFGGAGRDIVRYQDTQRADAIVTRHEDRTVTIQRGTEIDTLDSIELVVFGYGESTLGFLYGTDGADVLSTYSSSPSSDDYAEGGGGDDLIDLNSGVDVAFGGDGNDRITGFSGVKWFDGGAGDDILEGGQSNDTLIGGDGADQLNGNSGDDFLYGGLGDDILRGGYGQDDVDTAVFSGNAADYVLAGNYTSLIVTGIEGRDSLINIERLQFADRTINLLNKATIYDDVLTGTSGADVIDGLAGHDDLSGLDGADTLRGGDGNDVLRGGLGADALDGGAGIDTADFSDLTAAMNIILGAGVAIASTGETDTLVSIENAIGTALADTINGDAAANRLEGRGGADVLFGNGGNDVLEGGDGNDTLVGNADLFAQEADTLNGGAGDDLLYGEFTDTLNGGIGFDSLIAINAYDWSLDMAATSIEYAVMDFGNDTVTAANQTVGVSIFTSGGNDDVTGSAFDDLIFGGVGDDVIRGGNGADAIVGDLGADQLFGGDGDDRIYFDRDDTVVSGGAGYDAGYITPASTSGGVTINLATASLEFIQDFAGGDDVIDGSGLTQGFSAYLGAGADTVTGSDLNDILWGEAGNDVLSGGLGADVLVGGAGADRLRGGAGNDRLYGGAADSQQDVFVFEHLGAANRDFVYEFELAHDRIDLSAFAGATFADVVITTGGGSSIVSLNGEQVCVLSGVVGLTAANFVFAAAAAAPDLSGKTAPLVQPMFEDPWVSPSPEASMEASIRPSWLSGGVIEDYAYLV